MTRPYSVDLRERVVRAVEPGLSRWAAISDAARWSISQLISGRAAQGREIDGGAVCARSDILRADSRHHPTGRAAPATRLAPAHAQPRGFPPQA
jgi:hypothetical protein